MGLNLGTGFALGNSLNNLPPKTGNGTGGTIFRNTDLYYDPRSSSLIPKPPQFAPRYINTQNRNPVPQNIQFGNNPFQNGQQVGLGDVMRVLGNQQTIQNRNPVPQNIQFGNNPFQSGQQVGLGNQRPFFGTPSQAFMPETDWVRMANAGYDRAGRPIQQPLPRRPMQNQPQPQPQRPNIPWLMW